MTMTHPTESIRRIKFKFPLILFAATALFYLAFSPATIEGMGYYGENLNAADQLASNLINLIHRQPFIPVTWTRHGGLELIVELPFVLISHLFFGASVKWAGRVLALQPILATALIVTLLFAWFSRLTGNRQTPMNFLGPDLQAFQTIMPHPSGDGLQIKAAAIIPYLQRNVGCLVLQSNKNSGGLRMFDRIFDGLLRRPQQMMLNHPRERATRPNHLHFRPQ